VTCRLLSTVKLLDSCYQVNLRCDPDRALDLRDRHEAIMPGDHMNKTHWTTVDLSGNLPRDLVRELIDHSYQLVVAPLPKKLHAELDQ
jgi:predicted DNA-binding protein (MmcQ/YjbR family)